MEYDNIEEMIEKAKEQRRQRLFEQRVALFKAEDALKQLGGEDDYKLSLSAIVKAYPKGVTLTRVRQLLTDSELLDVAKEELKAEDVIEVGMDKRSPLLTPKSVAKKPSDGASGEPALTTPTPKEPTPKSTKAVEGEDAD